MNAEDRKKLRDDLILEIIDLIKTKQTKKPSQHTKALKEAIRST